MGINDGVKLVYQILGLTFSQLFAIARDRAMKNCRPGQPVLDIDASWLWYKFKPRSGGPLGNIIDFVKFLAVEGFAVHVVCDSDDRHHSKRASIKRRVDKEYARFMAIEAKAQIMRISIKLREAGYESETERRGLENKREWLSKFATNDESIEDGGPPEDYYVQLRDALTAVDTGHRGGSIAVIKAVSQADFYIAYRVVHNLTDVVVSNDADYSILTGTALCIADFKFSSRKTGGYMYGVNLRSACKSTMTSAGEVTRIDTSKKNDQYIPATFTLLDGASPRLRCLFAVAIGCDSLPGGIKNLGIAKIDEKYHAGEDPATYDEMLQWLAQKMVKRSSVSEVRAVAVAAKKAMLETLVDSLMFEPADVIEDANGQTVFIYIHETPDSLPIYLKEFASSQTAVTEGPSLSKCHGYGRGEHLFIAEDGTGNCKDCDNVYCRLCTVDVNKRENARRKKGGLGALPEKHLCLECIAGTAEESNTEICRLSEMRDALEDHGINFIAKATDGEIMDMHDVIVDQKELDAHSELIGQIPFPELKAATITDGTLSPLIQFDMCNGANFLLSDALDISQIIDVVDLFASLVVYADADDPALKSFEDILPQMVLKYCSGSRVDPAQRLASRTIRHGNDPNADSAFNASCALAEHDGSMVMIMHHNMYASFKTQRYETSVAFRKGAIVACQCGCQAGAEIREKHDRHVDVHIIPVIYLLVLLLFEGLAYDILVHLAERWKPSDDSHPKAEVMAGAIDLLRVASGKESGLRVRGGRALKVSELLTQFAVGTEKGKLATPPPRATDELGPIRRHVRFVHPKAKAKKRIRLVKRMANESTEGSSEAENDGDNHSGELMPAGDNGGGSNETAEDHDADEEGDDEEIDPDAVDEAEKGLTPFDPAFFLLTRFTKAWKNLTGRSSPAYDNFVGYRAAEIEGGLRSNEEVALIDNSASEGVASIAERTIKRGWKPEKMSATIPPNEPGKEGPKEPSSSRFAGTRRGCCCFDDCQHSKLDPNLEGGWTTLPRMPKPLNNPNTASLKKRKTYSKRLFTRAEWNRRCSLPEDDSADRRACNRHKIDDNNKFSVTLKHRKSNANPPEPTKFPYGDFNKKQKGIVEPKGKKRSNVYGTPSRGVGADRELRRVIQLSKQEAHQKVQDVINSNPEMPQQVQELLKEQAGDLTSWRMHAQQSDAVREAERRNESIHDAVSPIVAQEAEILAHSRGKSATQELPSRPAQKRSRDSSSAADDPTPANKDPVVTLNTTDKDVKECTGFDGLLSMLFFITVVCNCDVDMMSDTVTSMTWLEEWHLYFEMVWRRSCLRWSDARRKYGLSERRLQLVFIKKLALVKRAKRSWPRYMSMEVDRALRNEKWNVRYDGKRVVMWDNTNIDLYKPYDASMQRRTYSSYYGGNVAKGAVGLQLCGWIIPENLWDGAVSDSQFFEQGEILKEQEKFVAASNETEVPFTNILDKGYHAALAAWRAGKQLVLQPAYKKAERKFTSQEVLLSAAVAADRSGNERAVNVSKRCGMLQRRVAPTQLLTTLDDVWLAWGFQVNFMYAPVH